jgi:hypothetical protein
MTRFLSIAITCASQPFRTRLTSSFNVPSRRPCSPFSIPQCRRTDSSSRAAPLARQAGDPDDHLDLDLTTSAPLAQQAEDLPAARPILAQVSLQGRRHLQGPLLDPAMPLVDRRVPIDLRLAPRRLEGARPLSGPAKTASMSRRKVG